MEITKDKVTELFCIIDEFYKVFDAEKAGKLLLGEDGVKCRQRKASLSDSEIMTILLVLWIQATYSGAYPFNFRWRIQSQNRVK